MVWEYLTPHEDYAVAGEPEVKVPTVDGVDRPTLGHALVGLARVLNRRGAHEQALGMVERGLAMVKDLPVELRVAFTRAELFPTVEGLFALIGDGIRSGTRPLSAQYDSALGYPTRFSIGEPAADAPLYVISREMLRRSGWRRSAGRSGPSQVKASATRHRRRWS